VDERLFYLYGRRPARLRVSDLPEVAKAIVAVVRGRARSSRYGRRGVDFVHLHGVGVDVCILLEDWKKIAPYIADGSFNPAVVPVARTCVHPGSEASIVDLTDVDFYTRVLNTLKMLFTVDFPTSNL